ncbi:hypothetical protein BS17DRAFT_690773, partial [Gyrodon lividus]
HNVRNCSQSECWDRTPTWCHHNADRGLVNPQGSVICTDWQCPFGCHSKHPSVIHECSGTAPNLVLEHRRSEALTPHILNAWDCWLRASNLVHKYPAISDSL